MRNEWGSALRICTLSRNLSQILTPVFSEVSHLNDILMFYRYYVFIKELFKKYPGISRDTYITT